MGPDGVGKARFQLGDLGFVRLWQDLHRAFSAGSDVSIPSPNPAVTCNVPDTGRTSWCGTGHYMWLVTAGARGIRQVLGPGPSNAMTCGM